MRALKLTNESKPGGRPRSSRSPRSPFTDWLARCNMTPQEVATALGVSISSVYNLRNSFFVPGRSLGVAIEELTEGAVPVASWDDVKVKERKPQKRRKA